MTNIRDRLNKLHAKLDEIIGKRVPGDGDGDGIANEGRKPKGGGAARRATHYDAAQASKLLGYTNPATINNPARLQQMRSSLKVNEQSRDLAARNSGRSTPLRYKVALDDMKIHIDNRLKELAGGSSKNSP